MAWRARWRFAQMLHLPAHPEPELPSVAVIVPARNEAKNLERLLPSLNALAYPGHLQVSVVDDGSIDDTAKVARRHQAACLQLNKLPAGWLGKPHACHQGALLADSDLLLFTDADTCHSPDSLARAVSLLLLEELDALSLFPSQRFVSWWDALPLSAAFAGLFAVLPRRFPLVNGQYVLVRREAYFASGGFGSVRQEPVEDLAFGARLQAQGFRLAPVNGAGVLDVHMYDSFASVWRGLTRIGAGSLPWLGSQASLSVAMVISGLMPLLGGLLWSFGLVSPAAAALAWSLVIAGLYPWLRSGRAWVNLWAAPLGVLIVQAAATWGLAARLMHIRQSWKGRLI
jgi:chlorobactene glucosyltransferase